MCKGILVVKKLACCAGGPVFDPRKDSPKFSRNLHQQNLSWMSFRLVIELAVPCTSVHAGQVKDPTHNRVQSSKPEFHDARIILMRHAMSGFCYLF